MTKISNLSSPDSIFSSSKCTPDPVAAGGAYNAPPDPVVGWGGGYSLPIPLPVPNSAPTVPRFSGPPQHKILATPVIRDPTLSPGTFETLLKTYLFDWWLRRRCFWTGAWEMYNIIWYDMIKQTRIICFQPFWQKTFCTHTRRARLFITRKHSWRKGYAEQQCVYEDLMVEI